MTKMVRVEDEGYVWEFEAKLIAINRAHYYANKPGKLDEIVYEEEFDFTMSDDFELYDWFVNNMDWKDVAEFADLVESPDTKTEPGEDRVINIVEK